MVREARAEWEPGGWYTGAPLVATHQPHWRDLGSAGRGRCGAAVAVGWRLLGLVFFDTARGDGGE